MLLSHRQPCPPLSISRLLRTYAVLKSGQRYRALHKHRNYIGNGYASIYPTVDLNLHVRRIQYTRERRRWRRLQPVLVIIQGVRRRIDHMERVREPRTWARVAFGFMQHGSVNQDEVAWA